MKINENDLLPNSEVFVLENGEPTKKKIEDFFKNKKVVLFGLPGAYTSVCSAKHLPGYVKLHDKYKEKGIDHIICCLLYTSPSPRDALTSRMPSSA